MSFLDVGTVLSESAIRDISSIIPGNDWKQVLKSLGLTEPAISHIDSDERSTREKIYQGLVQWYEGGDASLSELTDTLSKIDPSTARKLRGEFVWFVLGDFEPP